MLEVERQDTRMKKVGVMTDSHSGISPEEAAALGIRVLPMPVFINGEVLFEDIDFTKREFYEKLEAGAEVSTSQPSPQDTLDIWDAMLEEYEQILYMPMSSGLSGSCMTAMGMAQDEAYEGKVFVVDNGRVGTPLHRSILDAVDLIEEGYLAPQIKEILENSKEDMTIYIAVDSLKYLKKGGRITAATAAVGTVLNMKPILRVGTGKLDMFEKCRGMKKARKLMIEALKKDIETRFKEQYEAGELYLMTATSSSPELTAEWIEQVKEAFPDMEVMSDYLTCGIACHTGPGGLGIGCACKPRK